MHPILGYEKLHDGTDISGAGINGTPILAAYSGTVVLAQSYWGYGNCVKIDHGGGVVTLYAHASAILVSVGQQVNPVTRLHLLEAPVIRQDHIFISHLL